MPTAKLFCALMYASAQAYAEALDMLVNLFGEVEECSEEYDFSYTDYYQAEFGRELKKRFVLFGKSIERSLLPQIKLQTIALEDGQKIDGKRVINIDPGYITKDQVVVASVKEMPHRVYLDLGIFADVQLILTKSGAFTYRHTFDDYTKHTEFFVKARERLVDNPKNSKKGV